MIIVIKIKNKNWGQMITTNTFGKKTKKKNNVD